MAARGQLTSLKLSCVTTSSPALLVRAKMSKNALNNGLGGLGLVGGLGLKGGLGEWVGLLG